MVVDYHQFQTYNTVLILTVNVTLCLIVMLAACICCTKKKVPKNELLGLEGMVKMKNPDDVIIVTTVRASESQADLNSSTISNADSDKRASTAAHRSLPDIPVGDGNGDNGSELYETVADKRLMDAQNSTEKSPAPSLKKQISVSQHSSISQADDVSSPYSRVKNNPHDYAKLRSEHPYAQLNAPSTSTSAASTVTSAAPSSSQVAASPNQLATHAESLNRNSQHSDTLSQSHDTDAPQAEIPAASAIAGMISASQDLPYMTPPIGNQHFSGDSQDSSKGYTSISVREPLANILAQQPAKVMPSRSGQMSRDTNDSHYATVSDDSDETYAAIEDPNGRIHPNVATDIYTSGSETYAQIQPMQPGNPIVVSVEINQTSTLTRQADGPTASGSQLLEVTASSAANSSATSPSNNLSHMTAVAGSSTANQQQSVERTSRPASEGHMQAMQSAHVDSLRAQMHSRQASCSSNNSSSMGNLGSPKPEKRQANSPLPPTPKSSTLPASSNSSLTSGRNSVISVIESGVALLDMGGGNLSATSSSSVAMTTTETSPQKSKTKSLSPSKDIEGMYAKVMKKNKFSRHSPSSQNSSPVMIRKNDPSGVSAYLGVSPLDSAAAELIDTHKITIATTTATTLNEKSGGRMRSNSYNAKDHGYETIPADAMRQKAGQATGVAAGDHRKSECYTSVLKKEIEAVGGGGGAAGGGTTTIALGQLLLNDEKYYETIAASSSTTAAVLVSSTSSKTTLSLLNNSDPGYETLHKDCSGDLEEDHEKKSSDYDPNYEVLKTNVAGLSDDGYAKVVEKKRLHIDEEDATDGYSKVKGDLDDGGNGGGYSTIRDAAERLSGPDGDLAADANHNYASILETKGGGGGIHGGAQSESESDHYARIAEGRPHKTPDKLPLNLVVATSGGGLVETTSPTLPITSPSSINSASLFLSSSTPVSSSNMTSTTSASTMSSRPTPTSSSQYESLTGSDTDPNYESVCYLNTSGRENPYERLPTEYSDTQLSSQRSSPLTSTTDDESRRKAPNGTKAISAEVGSHGGGDVVVDDYFQV